MMSVVARQYDVCVVGGGPVGLAAAIAMAQSGRSTVLLERAQAPVDKACGEGLLPDAMEALHQLGVNIPSEFGCRFTGIRFLDREHETGANFSGGSGLGLRRTVLHRLLAERARDLGVQLEWNVRSAALSGDAIVTPDRKYSAELLVAADGQNSRIRSAAGLNAVRYERWRFGFRQHFAIEPWSEDVQVFWDQRCQVYVTPVAAGETGVAVLTGDPRMRVAAAVERFPDIARRLRNARPVSREMGALSTQRRLRRVARPGLALVGDASGSVDAITGEGLGLGFRQALALARFGLDRYPAEHAAICRRTRGMARLLLLLSEFPLLRRRVMAGFARHPDTFRSLLAVHAGEIELRKVVSWDLLQTCCAILSR